MLTVEEVEAILSEIVGPDQREIGIQFPHVHVQTRRPNLYSNSSGQILTRIIEISGTTGPMTFGYDDTELIEPPETGVREPRRPLPPGPTNAVELPGPKT